MICRKREITCGDRKRKRPHYVAVPAAKVRDPMNRKVAHRLNVFEKRESPTRLPRPSALLRWLRLPTSDGILAVTRVGL
jgi:hypothetical protein